MHSRMPLADTVIQVYDATNGAAPGDMPVWLLTLKHTLRAEKRVIGMQRHYAALQAQVQLDGLLRVPRLPDISPQDMVLYAENGEEKAYRITQIQYPPEFPLVMDVSLERVEERYEFSAG